MPLKPKDAGHKPEKRKVTFEDTSFFNGIINDKYILVLGSGVILNKDKYPETNGDINVFLLNTINNYKHTNYESLSDVVSAFPLEVSPLYSLLIEDIDYDINDMSVELIELLKTRYFKYVFTTTPDHYVEILMHGIWDNELRVVNFSDENSVRNFYDAIKFSKGEYQQPTLFYVFGKAIEGQKNPTKFLETDSDAIAYIEEWIRIEKDSPLISFLKKKRILSIGCNFDDWYHRFFWHILTYNFTREDYSYNDNAVLSKKIGKLEEYLNLNNVCVHSDPWAVLSYITYMLTARSGESKFTEMVRLKSLEGKVFLSYKNSPDSELAISIFNMLSQQTALKIWIDSSSLLGGQHYNKRIPEAIKFSQIFIPILTASIAKILNEYEIEELMNLELNNGLPFFIQEWKWASEVKGIIIIPIAFDGYDLRGPEHQKFEAIIYRDNSSSLPSGIDMGCTNRIESESIEKLINSIYKALGIYE